MTLSLTEALNKAIVYLQAGDLENAEELFLSVLKVQPDNADALHLLGIVRLQQGQAEAAMELMGKAVKQCHKALEEDINNLQVNLLLAHIYMDTQQWSHAEPYYRQVLRVNPDLAEAYSGLGSIYFNQGQLRKAFSMYYQALKKDGNNVEALYNQGIVLRSLGQLSEAEVSLSQAVTLAPTYVAALASLGLTLQELERYKEAEAAYKKVLKVAPDNSFANHMLAAIQGKTTKQAPVAFIADLFDAYAPAYEQHLLDQLEFKAPMALAECVLEHCADILPFNEVLDLGCGTGLMADKLKGSFQHMDGMDLSRKMLSIANAKNCYRSLTCDDIKQFFESSNELYDCCLASDVFIYSGELREIFLAVHQHLKDSGVFAFTTEGSEKDGYLLLNSGRYAHSISYIEKVARDSGFSLSLQKSVQLRKEEGRWLDGSVYILTKVI